MDKRSHNIIFHTHTISGIILSVALYVMFFAGSFSFFRDEINNWERGERTENHIGTDLDFNRALDSLNNTYSLYGRDISMEWPQALNRVNVRLSPSKDSLATGKQKKGAFLYLNTVTYEQETYDEGYSLGEFLYRLHFFAQIPNRIGYLIAGFISFFFIFAIITGVLVHWDNIVRNFYVFRPLAKLKTIWTDAHTSLGIIGLPFQFIYAVTGAFFMIQVVFVSPAVNVLYNGDKSKFDKDLEYSTPIFPFENQRIDASVSINMLYKSTEEKWADFKPTSIKLLNYGDRSMKVFIEGQTDYINQFTGVGKVLYNGVTGAVALSKDPYQENTYLDGVKNVFFRLHYGDYGGYALKWTSLFLGLISCFVIISGVMIWLVARDKKTVTERKRKFNAFLVRLYLAICLGMYPMTALAFVLVKINGSSGKAFLYPIYFIGWLVLSVLLMLKRDNSFIIKFTLFSGSILGLLVPICNGYLSGNWLWKSIYSTRPDSFMVDMVWIVLSVLGLFVYYRITRLSVSRRNQRLN